MLNYDSDHSPTAVEWRVAEPRRKWRPASEYECPRDTPYRDALCGPPRGDCQPRPALRHDPPVVVPRTAARVAASVPVPESALRRSSPNAPPRACAFDDEGDDDEGAVVAETPPSGTRTGHGDRDRACSAEIAETPPSGMPTGFGDRDRARSPRPVPRNVRPRLSPAAARRAASDDDAEDADEAWPAPRPSVVPRTYPTAGRGVNAALRDARIMNPAVRYVTRPGPAKSRGPRSVPGRYTDTWKNQSAEIGVDLADMVRLAAARGSDFTRNAMADNPAVAEMNSTAAVTSGLSSQTFQKYAKQFELQFKKPFYNKYCVGLMVPIPPEQREQGGPTERPFHYCDLSEEDATMWANSLIYRGTVGGPSLKAYFQAARRMWVVEMLKADFDPNNLPPNPFDGPAMRSLQQNVNKRMKPTEFNAEPRTALEPNFFRAILDSVSISMRRFTSNFGLEDYRKYTPWKFEHGEFLAVRAQVAVLICYAFGLRAKTLYFVTENDITIRYLDYNERREPKMDGRVTLAYLKNTSGSKNWTRSEHTEPRTLPHNDFSHRLASMFELYMMMKRMMFAYRLVDSPEGDIMDPRNFYPIEDHENIRKAFNTADEHWKFVNRISDINTVSPERYLFIHWGENIVRPPTSPCEKVSTWLRYALRKANVYQAANQDRKLTSHAIRAGAASAFICANRLMRHEMRWFFGWDLKSNVAEDNYIQHSWTIRDQPDCKYFWGVWSER